MFPEMDNILLDLPSFTVGANGLVVGAVLLTVPLYVDGSYVDGNSCVVFIIDTTYRLSSSGVACQQRLLLVELLHHDAEVVRSVVLLFLDGHLQDVLF